MRRTALLTFLLAVSLTGPASAAPATSAAGHPHHGPHVRGGLRGDVVLTPGGSGCIAVSTHDGRIRATVLGRGTYHMEACVYSDATGAHVVGLMTITLRRSTLEGHIDQPMGEPLVTIDVTGGTGRFRRATGELVLELEQYDQTHCYPQAGICFEWKERGTVTGRIRLGR